MYRPDRRDSAGGGWQVFDRLTERGAPPFRVCFLKGWAILR
jgi:hypothetical protein